MSIIANELFLLLIAILSIFLGKLIFKNSKLINKLNFPPALIGGSIALFSLSLFKSFLNLNIQINSELSHLLLIAFFAAGGLLIDLKTLRSQGKPLIKLCGCCLLLIIGQNLLGLLIAITYEWSPLLGLLSGSVAFVGGLGSAAAWGQEFANLGIENAKAMALVCASAALITGALISSPYSEWLIHRKKISSVKDLQPSEPEVRQSRNLLLGKFNIALVLLSITVIIALSIMIGPFLRRQGLILPDFISGMILALIIGNIKPFNSYLSKMHKEINYIEEQSLDIFIVLSLIGLDVFVLKTLAWPLLFICLSQILLTLLIADLLVFKVMGRDYESAVITGGLIGFGLSSYAVAMTTVQQLRQRYGHAPRAVMLIAITGGALVNLINSIIICLFYLILE